MVSVLCVCVCARLRACMGACVGVPVCVCVRAPRATQVRAPRVGDVYLPLGAGQAAVRSVVYQVSPERHRAACVVTVCV